MIKNRNAQRHRKLEPLCDDLPVAAASSVRDLTQEELARVAGGDVLQAEDMYGNKLSHEDYMDYQLALANRYGLDEPEYGVATRPHDFTSWSKW